MTREPFNRPILFSGPMVRALLDGGKTQTRRVLKPQPFPVGGPFYRPHPLVRPCEWYSVSAAGFVANIQTVAFAPGDRLWVREAWRSQQHFDGKSPAEICAEFQGEYGAASCPAFYEADKRCDGHSVYLWQQSPPGRLRASMHMPRCASRLTLIVTAVRVQRLQEISTDDCVAEGIDRTWLPGTSSVALMAQGTAKAAYRTLWDSLNAKRGYGWDANPWVVALTFTVHRSNIDEMPPEAIGDGGLVL
jgi:hypothetical protein